MNYDHVVLIPFCFKVIPVSWKLDTRGLNALSVGLPSRIRQFAQKPLEIRMSMSRFQGLSWSEYTIRPTPCARSLSMFIPNIPALRHKTNEDHLHSTLLCSFRIPRMAYTTIFRCYISKTPGAMVISFFFPRRVKRGTGSTPK